MNSKEEEGKEERIGSKNARGSINSEKVKGNTKREEKREEKRVKENKKETRREKQEEV